MFEAPLGGGTSDAAKRSVITIKFAVAAEPRGDVNANEFQATNTVEGPTETVSAPRSTLQIVGQVDSAIGAGTNITTEVQIFENTWNVLLQRMTLFNNIVSGIAEVFDIQRLVSFPC